MSSTVLTAMMFCQVVDDYCGLGTVGVTSGQLFEFRNR